MRSKAYNIVKFSLLILVFALLVLTLCASFIDIDVEKLTFAADDDSDPTITITPAPNTTASTKLTGYDSLSQNTYAYPVANVCTFNITISKSPSSEFSIYYRTVDMTAVAESKDYTAQDKKLTFQKNLGKKTDGTTDTSKLTKSIQIIVGTMDMAVYTGSNSNYYLSRYFKIEIYKTEGLKNDASWDATRYNTTTKEYHYAYGMISATYFEAVNNRSFSVSNGTFNSWVLDAYYATAQNGFDGQSASTGSGVHATSYAGDVEMDGDSSTISVSSLYDMKNWASEFLNTGQAHVYFTASYSADGEDGTPWDTKVDISWVDGDGQTHDIMRNELDGYFTWYNYDMRYYWSENGASGLDHNQVQWSEDTRLYVTDVMRLYSGVGPWNAFRSWRYSVTYSTGHGGSYTVNYDYYYKTFETFYKISGVPTGFKLYAKRTHCGADDYIKHIKYYYALVDDVAPKVTGAYLEDTTGKTKNDKVHVYLRLSEPVYISSSDKAKDLYIKANINNNINYSMDLKYCGGEYTDTLIFEVACKDFYEKLNNGRGVNVTSIYLDQLVGAQYITDFSNPNHAIGTVYSYDDFQLKSCSKQGICNNVTYANKDSGATKTWAGTSLKNVTLTTTSNAINCKNNLRNSLSSNYASSTSITFLAFCTKTLDITVFQLKCKVSIDAREAKVSDITCKNKLSIMKSHTATITLANDNLAATVYYSWSEDVGESSASFVRPTKYDSTKTVPSQTTKTYTLNTGSLTGIRFLFIKVISNFGNMDERVCGPFYFDNSADDLSGISISGGNLAATTPSEDKSISFYIDYGENLRTASQVIQMRLYCSESDVWDESTEFESHTIYSPTMNPDTRCSISATDKQTLNEYDYKIYELNGVSDTSVVLNNFYKTVSGVVQTKEYTKKYQCSYTVKSRTLLGLKDGEFKKLYLGISIEDKAGNIKSISNCDTAKVIGTTDTLELNSGKTSLNVYEAFDGANKNNVVATLTQFNRALIKEEHQEGGVTDYYVVTVNGVEGIIKKTDADANCTKKINQSYETDEMVLVFFDTRKTRASLTTFDSQNDSFVTDNSINAFNISGSKTANFVIELVEPLSSVETRKYQISKSSLSTKGLIQTEEYTDEAAKARATRQIIVAQKSINIYSTTDTTSALVATMVKGDKAIIKSETADFYQVDFVSKGESQIGYIPMADASSSYLTDEQISKWFDVVACQVAIASTNGVEIYKSVSGTKGTSFNTPVTMLSGDKAIIDSVEANSTDYFYKVTYGNVVGYVSKSAVNTGEGYYSFTTKNGVTDIYGLYTFQLMVYKRAVALKTLDINDATNKINVYSYATIDAVPKDPSTWTDDKIRTDMVIEMNQTTKLSLTADIVEIVKNDSGTVVAYKVKIGDKEGYVKKSDVDEKGVITTGTIQYTVAFDVYYGNNENNTVNLSQLEQGSLYLNRVYRISSSTKYYYKLVDGTVVSEGYGAKNDVGTVFPAVFSTQDVAITYLKYMEYQDLYLVKITDSTMAKQFNDKNSTTYTLATKESQVAAPGQYWIRYKRSTWTDSGTIDSWCYYYYSDGLETINTSALSTILLEAIDTVVANIIKKYGEEILLTSNGGLNEYGSPYINPMSIKYNAEEVLTTKTKSPYSEELRFPGDPAIYASNVNVEVDDAGNTQSFLIGSTYKISISEDTNLYYAKYKAYLGPNQPLEYKKIAKKDGAILKDIIKTESGLYSFLEIDKYGSKVLTVYIDKSAPTLVFTYSRLDANGEEEIVEAETDSSLPSYTYNAMSVNILYIAESEIDKYSYIAIYNKTTGYLDSAYTIEDLKMAGGVKLSKGIYYVEVYDRSGNNYRIDFRLNAEVMDWTIKEIKNSSISLNISNRIASDIYRYEITYNNDMIVSTFQQSITFTDSGQYFFYVEDWYGNVIDEERNFIREVPTISWAYSVDATGSSFTKYVSNEKTPGMKIQAAGGQTFNVITASFPRMSYSITSGIEHVFIGEKPNVSTLTLIDCVVTAKELVNWSVKVYYTKYPNIYAIYNIIIDNAAPVVNVSFDQATYSKEEQNDVALQQQRNNITTEGKEIDPTRIDFKQLSVLPRTISDKMEISAKNIQIKLADNTGIIKVKIAITPIGGNKEEVLFEQNYRSPLEADHVVAEGETPLTVFDQNANVFTYSRFGVYHIYAYDILNTCAEFTFTNSNNFDVKYYVDDEEIELPYVLDDKGNKTDVWSFVDNFSDTTVSSIKLIGSTEYYYYNSNKGITFVLNNNNVCYYLLGEVKLTDINSTTRAYNSVEWSIGDTLEDSDYIYLGSGTSKTQTFRIIDELGTLNYVENKEDYSSTKQIYNKIEFGNTSQIISLSRNSTIQYIITDYEDPSVIKYIGLILEDGKLYFYHWETALEFEVSEDGTTTTQISETSIIDVVDTEYVLYYKDSKRSPDFWYELLNLPMFNTALEGRYDSNGRFQLRIKASSVNDMIISIECKVCISGAVYEPSYFKTYLSNIESDIDVYHYIDDASRREKIDTTGATSLEYIKTNGNIYIDLDGIDQYFIKSAQISYSEVNQFTNYTYFYDKDGIEIDVKRIIDKEEKIVKEKLTKEVDGELQYVYFIPIDEAKDGFYRIVIENVFGNIRTYNFIVSNECLITMSARFTDGEEFFYSKDYEETVYSNYQVAIQVYNLNVEAVVYKDNEVFEYEVDTKSQYFEILLSQKGSYKVILTDEYGNVIEKNAVINYADLDLDSDVLYGFNEKALRKTEGYTNQIVSINGEKAIGQGVKYIAIRNGSKLTIIYDEINEKKVAYNVDNLKKCIGLDGTANYDVIFRDLYGNMLVRHVYYKEESTFILTRQTRTSQFAQDYTLEKALEIGFWSNHILTFKSTAYSYTFMIDGSTTICPRTLNFTSNVTEGNIEYDIYYLDEYGFEYSFKAHLYRTSVPVVPSNTVEVQQISQANYTRSNISLSFDSLAKCTYTYQDVDYAYEYKLGDVIKKDGKYRFVVEDYAGNTSTYTIIKDTICDYQITNGAEGPVVEQGFIIGKGNAVFAALNGDSVKIKSVFLNEELQEGYGSTSFSKDGKWEIFVEDAVGNQSYYMFYIITNALNHLYYSAPKDYEVSDIWFTSSEGISVNYSALIEKDKNGNTAFDFREDGTYTLILKSTVTSVTYSFTFTITTVPPQTELDGCANGEETINNIKIKGTVAGDTIFIYKDGKLVQTYSVTMNGESPEISEEGDYRIVVRSSAGNEVEYTFTRRHVANTAGSALLIIVFVLIAVGLFVALIYRNRSKVDK